MWFMYCPSCGTGTVVIVHGAVAVVTRHPQYGHSTMFKFARFVACTDCPLVSEVDPESGDLIDVGLTVADLQTSNTVRRDS